MKKIVCPVDFSTASLNAIEYAAQLARSFKADLLLVNVQEIVLPAVGIGLNAAVANVHNSTVDASGRLKAICAETRKGFNVAVDYEVDVTTKSFIKTLSELGTGKTMIVMGTDGVDDMYQYFFGTNSYHVIKKTDCPVLVVPENARFKEIRKIIFAWDYKPKSKITFSVLENFMSELHPYFTFLHVSRQKTGISHDVFGAIRNEVETLFGEDNDHIDFAHAYSDDITGCINSYMIESKADMLALTYYDRGLIGNIFHGTVAKELSATAIYPILVLHN